MNKKMMKKIAVLSLFPILFLFVFTKAIYEQKECASIENEWNVKVLTDYDFNSFNRVIKAEDGYLAVGYASFNHIMAMKLDENGNIIWKKIYKERPFSGISVTSGKDGYLIVGNCEQQLEEIIAIKIDENGNEIWNKTYVIGGRDLVMDVIWDEDGYIIGGETGNFPDQDFLMKIDENGNIIWIKFYGGKDDENLQRILKCNDGYVFVGYTASYGHGHWDAWLVKVDRQGNEIWNKTYGGADTDEARCIALTSDGGFIITGITMSYGNGGTDVFIIKTDKNGNMEWKQTFGGNDFEGGEAIIETEDGYIIAGATISFGAGDFDGLLLKVDKNGNIVWYRTFGGENRDVFWDMLYDNGYFVLAGLTAVSSNPYKEAGWIVKCNDEFPPELKITSPENGIYINDRKLIPFSRTIAIGKITFEAEINCTIEEMRSYVDGKLNKTFYSPPFRVELNERGIEWHNVKFVAYFGNAGENRAVEKEVFMVNPFPTSSVSFSTQK